MNTTKRGRRHFVSWCVCMCAASCALGTSTANAGPDLPAPATLLDGCQAWWQFDRVFPLLNERETNEDLAEVGTPVLAPSPTGIEHALTSGDAGTGGFELGGALVEAPTHWSNAFDRPLTGLVVFRLDAVPGADLATLIGRWDSTARRQWRLGLEGISKRRGRVVFEAATDQDVVSLELPGLDVGKTYVAVFSIDESGPIPRARLNLWTEAGDAIGSAEEFFVGSVRDDFNALAIGIHEGDPQMAAPASIDVVAAWDRLLTQSETAYLTQPEFRPRYAEAAGSTGLRPPARHLERAAGVFDGDRRHVILGDSFALPRKFNRVFPGIMKYRAMEPWVAFTTGVSNTHAFLEADSLVDSDPENPRAIDADHAYRVEWTGGNLWNDHFGLPVFQVEELRAHPDLVLNAERDVWAFTLDQSDMENGATGRFAAPGDNVFTTLLYRGLSSATTQLPRVRFSSSDDADADETVNFNFPTPRQINASPSVQWDADFLTDPTFRIGEAVPGDLTQSERFLDLAGTVVFRAGVSGEVLPGQYYSTLSDNSWRLRGFAADAESDELFVKQFDEAQLVAWLDATTLSPSQPITFWWYVDAEPDSFDVVVDDAMSMIDIAESACNAVGLPEPTHVLVIPHKHRKNQRTNDALRLLMERYRDALFAVADDPAYSNVAAYSIYDATDGIYFNGSVEAQAWLVDNGYDAFEYGIFTGDDAIDLTETGDLLDSSDLHPLGELGGVFFASFLADAIDAVSPATCTADLDQSGIVNFFDLVTLLASLSSGCTGDCSADITGDGQTNFSDLIALLAQWGPC